MHPASLGRLLKRLGFSRQKARPSHPLKDPAAAAAFKKSSGAAGNHQRTHKRKRIRLFFQDEARIGQKGRTCHVWWRRGERPPGLCDKRFTFAYIFAAVEPGTDNAFALVMPYADTAAMQAFLDRFSETIAEDEHVVMVLDQAGWHSSAALLVPANVTLVPLPAYSPELNPVERVWLISRSASSRSACSTTTTPSLMPPQRLEQPPCRGRAHKVPMLLPMDSSGQCLGSAVL